MGNKINLYFVTTNDNKYKELKKLIEIKNNNIFLIQNKDYYYEIQDSKLENIANICSKNASNELNEAVVVDDSGLFIDYLNGFPGPYSNYVLSTIGNDGILKLMDGINKRTAYLKTVISFCKPNSNPICFTGILNGSIDINEKGDFGFGFDSIFKYKNKTLGEMEIHEKNKISSRSKAFFSFLEWYEK